MGLLFRRGNIAKAPCPICPHLVRTPCPISPRDTQVSIIASPTLKTHALVFLREFPPDSRKGALSILITSSGPFPPHGFRLLRRRLFSPPLCLRLRFNEREEEECACQGAKICMSEGEPQSIYLNPLWGERFAREDVLKPR